ncbi:MAG: hypothetical protein ACXAEU_11740 [Candidatus Hodarchaeales archaeon]|jgi:predicted transcriptional regulator
MSISKTTNIKRDGIIELLEDTALTLDELAEKLDAKVTDISTLIGDLLYLGQIEMDYESIEGGYKTYIKLKKENTP